MGGILKFHGLRCDHYHGLLKFTPCHDRSKVKSCHHWLQHNCYDGYLHVKPVVFWQQECLLQQYLPNLDRYIVLSKYDQRDYMEKLGIDTEVKN